MAALAAWLTLLMQTPKAEMDQEWFEMADIRRRKLNSAVWIPLRASQTLEAAGKRGHLGYREEFFGLGSIAVPLEKRARAKTLDWSDVGLGTPTKAVFRMDDMFLRMFSMAGDRT